jgi:hypothetical protein
MAAHEAIVWGLETVVEEVRQWWGGGEMNFYLFQSLCVVWIQQSADSVRLFYWPVDRADAANCLF